MRTERSPAARVGLALAALTILTGIGTVGFALTEKLPLLDALYMAVITLSTVGYQEVAPASPAGRVFTIVFIVGGVGAALYAVVALAGFLVEGHLRNALGRRAMERSIEALDEHVIVCGYGRLGRAIAEDLAREGAPLVVIDLETDNEEPLTAAGHPYVFGSALEDAVLRRAGIERARAIVIATGSDADNVFIALSARELNPDIALHARAESEAGMRRLRLAGADQVISLHREGGRRIANAILRPGVVDFIELTRPGGEAPIDLEEVELAPGCALVDRPLRDLPVRVSVVAMRRDGEPTHLHPEEDAVLRAGDHVVVVGDRENLGRLAALAQPS